MGNGTLTQVYQINNFEWGLNFTLVKRMNHQITQNYLVKALATSNRVMLCSEQHLCSM